MVSFQHASRGPGVRATRKPRRACARVSCCLSRQYRSRARTERDGEESFAVGGCTGHAAV